MSKISERLKELRGETSQAEMARQLGIPRPQWSKYENGTNTPGAEMVAQICTTHACSADWLLGLTEERGRASAGSADVARPFEDPRITALEREVTRLQGMVAGLKFALEHSSSAPTFACG